MTTAKIGSLASSKFFFLTDMKFVIDVVSYSSMLEIRSGRGFSKHTWRYIALNARKMLAASSRCVNISSTVLSTRMILGSIPLIRN